MAGTRSSARLSGSSPQSAKSTNGTKRKADDSSPSGTKAKRGRPSKAAKEQKTLEETISTVPGANAEAKDAQDTEMADAEGGGKDAGSNGQERNDEAYTSENKAETQTASGEAQEENNNGADKAANNDEDTSKANAFADKPEESTQAEPSTFNGATGDSKSAFDQVKADGGDAGTTSKKEDEKSEAPIVEGRAVVEDEKREEAMPSNVLEKGIIYFFTRGRVGVEDPDSVQDLQRSYFVLRPLPDGAKLSDGAIQDVGNNRLVALPKKVWPKSGKDRFMVFVEKAKATIASLKEDFFQGSSYSTKTTGTRHTPGVSLVGEGVYAMTTTGGGQGTTHLAYMLTIPKEMGSVQSDVGLAPRGSFVLSTKNPESSAPGNVLTNGANYSKEIMDEFQGRGWLAAHPKHLDFDNASMLIIGENFDSSSNLEPAPKDEKDDSKETPQEELEKLENENDLRVEHINGNDAVFADLGISSKEYSLMTTW